MARTGGGERASHGTVVLGVVITQAIRNSYTCKIKEGSFGSIPHLQLFKVLATRCKPKSEYEPKNYEFTAINNFTTIKPVRLFATLGG